MQDVCGGLVVEVVVVAGEEIGDNWLLQILFIVAKHTVYHIKFVKLPKLFLSLLGVLRIYFEIWEWG